MYKQGYRPKNRMIGKSYPFKIEHETKEPITYRINQSSFQSHKVIITQPIIITTIVGRIKSIIPRRSKRNLRLGRLGLLGPLISGTLLTHLLIARRGQGTRNLLDLPTGQLLDELLGELLRPGGVVRLLGVGAQQRRKGGGELGELVFGGRFEEGHGGEIHRVRGVRTVTHDHRLGRRAAILHPVHIHILNSVVIIATLGLTSTTSLSRTLGSRLLVHPPVLTKQIRRMRQIRLLLRAQQSRALLGLVLVRLIRLLLLSLSPPRLLVLVYPLGFGLLVRGGLGLRFGFGFGGFGFFFALDVAVFGCVPGVEDLY